MRPITGYQNRGNTSSTPTSNQSFIPSPASPQYRYQQGTHGPTVTQQQHHQHQQHQQPSSPQSIPRHNQLAPSRPTVVSNSNSNNNQPTGTPVGTPSQGPGSFAPRAPTVPNTTVSSVRTSTSAQQPQTSPVNQQQHQQPSTPLKQHPIQHHQQPQQYPQQGTTPPAQSFMSQPSQNHHDNSNNHNNITSQQYQQLQHQLQLQAMEYQRTILQLRTDISVEQTRAMKLEQDNGLFQHRIQELERHVLHERKLRLEIEQTLDRLGMRQVHTQAHPPHLRRTSSSVSEAPPPPPPTAPHRQAPQLDTQRSQITREAALSLSHDGNTVKSPTPSGPRRSPYNQQSEHLINDPFDTPAPSLAANTFAPPSASNDMRDTRLDSRRAITTNHRVDQQQALSPLEDDWTFDSPNHGFMHHHEMGLLIQSTLDRWSHEFQFSKDVKDFMLLEISDIIESAASEQLMKKQLERYHYELMTSPYQLVRKIGAGGFGSVYQGVEKSTGMPVAIKVISLEDTEDDVMIITREITALVQGHTCPQLIRYYGSDVKSTKLWIVMEYVNGGSLLDHIKIEPLSEKYIAIVAREVLLGLQYLNQEGKIHRDIKAANILIGTEGSVKLADFGASRALNDTMSKCNTFVGSPYWMSPDVITQHDYDGKADIWSLGITCIELAHGKPPHTNVNPMAVLQVIIRDPPPTLHGNFSKDFKDFVTLCLIKDPHQRPSVVELLKSKFIKNAKKTRVISELFGGEEQ